MKNLLVIGAGESGTGAALLGKKLGYNVLVSDFGSISTEIQESFTAQGIDFEQNGHKRALEYDADLVVKSPGIAFSVPVISHFQSRVIEIIDEIELASRNSKGKIIAITGSNGKTTTTSLCYHILKKAGLNVGLAGNIGQSWAGQLATEGDKDYWVLELSSFQLDGLKKFRANVAVLTNISADHLDRYDNKLENYVASKMQVFMNQQTSDAMVYNADDSLVVNAIATLDAKANKYPFSLSKKQEQGAYLDKEEIIITTNKTTISMSMFDVSLQGKHNSQNAMAAAIASRVLELRQEVIRESLSDFEGIEHRLEFVATINEVDYINDSKATNVNSTWWALESQEKPVVWIVGGVDKGNDYSELVDLVGEKVKAIVCLGKENTKIKEAFANKVEMVIETSTATQAVEVSSRIAEKGDVVLLSPACASFDLFANYQDRGDKFKKAVREL